MTHVLSITGSDNSGLSGLQLDLKVISEMGGHALTAATCIVMQNESEIHETINFPTDIIRKQIKHIINDFRPKALKVGLLRTPETVLAVRDEIVGCRSKVVAPGFLSSGGKQIIDDETIDAIAKHLIPEATLLIVRCKEAERLLNMSITTNEDMIKAAQELCEKGAKNVFLRGGKIDDNHLVALLYTENEKVTFFSSYNVEGWQQHGVGGALSAAITTRLAMSDDVWSAIRNAHEYVHSHIVYSVKAEDRKQRPADIYNKFINLLTANYKTAHDVQFYAERLCISTRYLAQITSTTVSKSPKQIIAEYLLQEAKQLLSNSRLSIKEIAVALGFSTTALFCKFFKQQEGITPSDYR